MDISTVLLFLIIFLLGRWMFRKPQPGLPPGPTPWPLLGNIPQLARLRHMIPFQIFEKFHKDYGDIFTLMIRNRPMIIVSGIENIREIFQRHGDYVSGRLTHHYLVVLAAIDKGLLMNPTNWKESRRFLSVAMKDFGVGKKSLEIRLQEEARELVTEITNQGEKPINIRELLNNAVSNIICSVAFGERFSYNDPKFIDVMDRLNYTTLVTNPSSLLKEFPFLWNLWPFKVQVSNEIKAVHRVLEFVSEQIEKHEETFDPSDIRDLVDILIDCRRKKDDTYGNLTEENVFRMIYDIFATGTETTTTFLSWFLLIMATRPNIQRKCREEITKVLGDGMPCSTDRGSLPYLEATILEVYRTCNIVPTTLPHCVMDTIKINGYIYPKGCGVLANTYSCHMNPKYWGDDVKEFKPERWINEEGALIQPPAAFIPFSVGPRACLGEQLAKLESFIFTVVLLQHFEFITENENQLLEFKGKLGVAHQPLPFKLIAKRL